MTARFLAGWMRRAWAAPPDPAPRGSGVLGALSRLYGLGVALHRPRVARAPIPVVSVGSIWVGGAGKTPLASAVAGIACGEGRKAAIVLRGYRGTVRRGVERVAEPDAPGAVRRFGDEACLHAAAQACAVYVAPNRIDGVRRAAEDGCDLVVLDDGMQHRRLARDLEIVSLPAGSPLGNGRLLPRGPLREPVTALARADLIVLAYAGGPGMLEQARARLADLAPAVPLLSWRARLSVGPFPRRDPSPPALREGARIALLCGLGNPETFRRTMREAGYAVDRVAAFPDHHPFSRREVEEVLERAGSARLDGVVTTQKDAMRIDASVLHTGVDLFVAKLGLEWIEADAEQVLRAKLRTCL